MRLLLLAMLAACAAPSSQPPAPDDGVIRGTVSAVDLGPMAYDGDAEITVVTEAGPVEVRVPARENLCAAAGQMAIGTLRVGDRVEVVGARDADGMVRPCESPEHRLTVLGSAASGETAVVRGLYTSGFETSSFRPCDGPDEQWWLSPSTEFSDRVEALRQEHGAATGRARWIVVEATVEGTLSEVGEHGHLGIYPREFAVTGIRELIFLTVDMNDEPTCR